MATLFSDDFNRADSTTIDATNYTENESGFFWEIASNQLVITTFSGSGTANSIITTTSAHSAVADVKISVDFYSGAAITAGDWAIGLRCTSGSNGYWLNIWHTGSAWTWHTYKNGFDGTDRGEQATDAITSGDKVTFEASGTGGTVTLKGYLNDSLVFTDTDSSSPITTANQVGLSSWSGDSIFDNLLVEDVGGGGGSSSGLLLQSNNSAGF